ncbi:MAG TPA: hypothetical protein PKC67_01950 [Kiritimatiellia bacterium]|nr:hypothetical protein [Kiritimatiellia bacterium]HMP33087.1 hypothetical protein [Kiritimatiellia bacterium]
MDAAPVQARPAGHRADRLPPHWRIGSVGVVLAAHLAWLGLAWRPVTVSTPERSVRAAPPGVTFLGDPPAIEPASYAADARLLYSPVLFALPTAIGFSGPMLAAAGTKQPPVELPTPSPRIRDLDQPFAASPFGASSRSLVNLIEQPRPFPAPPPREPEDVLPPATIPMNAFTVYWPDRPEQPREFIPVDAAATWVGRTAWDMVLYVCFDADGLIRQVMVEKPSPYQDVTAAVLRIARGMVFGAPMPDQCGRLIVAFQPAPEKKDLP